ncbi:MAG TPA: hypothetical protein VIT45_05420 [Allosphingosinicella sp.]
MNEAAWSSPAGLSGGAASPVDAGDRVRIGANFHPHYEVIAISGDRAWLRGLQYGTDHVIPIGLCRPMPPRSQELPCN